MISNKTICIIGFGEVGATTASLLNPLFTESLFNIVDSSTTIQGRFLDFSHACALQLNDAVFNAFDLIDSSDLVVYCAGFSNEKGTSRLSVAGKNKLLAQELFSGIKLKPQTLVVVVTNPVELVTQWIYEALQHSNLVVGTGTSLDTFRLNSIISERESLKTKEINTLVLGEHGQHMCIIPSHSWIGKNRLDRYYQSHEHHELFEQLVSSAAQIRMTEKATKYGVSTCVATIVKAFYGEKPQRIPLSVKINHYYANLLDCESELFLSLPCIIQQEDIRIEELAFSEEEITLLKLAAKKLHNHL